MHRRLPRPFKTAAPHQRSARRLRLEALEERRLLAVTAVDDHFTIDEDTVLAVGPAIAAELGDEWLYFDDIYRNTHSYPDGNQAAEWNELGYDAYNPEHGHWETGNALFAYGTIDAGATVTGVNGPSSLYTTHLFRRTFTLDADQAQSTTGTINYLFDDGALVYINGECIYAANMGLPADTDDFALSIGDENGYTQDTVDLSGAGLIEGENVLAVELHNLSNNSPDTGMDMSLCFASVGSGRSRALS